MKVRALFLPAEDLLRVLQALGSSGPEAAYVGRGGDPIPADARVAGVYAEPQRRGFVLHLASGEWPGPLPRPGEVVPWHDSWLWVRRSEAPAADREDRLAIVKGSDGRFTLSVQVGEQAVGGRPSVVTRHPGPRGDLEVVWPKDRLRLATLPLIDLTEEP